MGLKRKRPGVVGGLDSDDEVDPAVDISVAVDASSGSSSWSYKRLALGETTGQPASPETGSPPEMALPPSTAETEPHPLFDGSSIIDEKKCRPQVRY
jgi:hypothetical protein